MPRKPKFSIISPGWRCQDYVNTWYKSLFKQHGDYEWQAYALDDHSNDRTHRVLQEIKDLRVVPFRNTRSMGAAYSRLKLMRKCSPKSIMVMLDLDDWLTPNAFNVLARAYRDPKIMATFGSYVRDKGGGVDNKLYSSKDIDSNNFINKPKFQAPPLRTFKASMVDYIEDSDMQDAAGKWYKTATDVALSWRFLWELQSTQVKHISEPLYVYRDRGGSSANRFSKKEAFMDLQKKYATKAMQGNIQKIVDANERLINEMTDGSK